jgi:hypothetical protein
MPAGSGCCCLNTSEGGPAGGLWDGYRPANKHNHAHQVGSVPTIIVGAEGLLSTDFSRPLAATKQRAVSLQVRPGCEHPRANQL